MKAQYTTTVKILKFCTPEKIAVIILKFEQYGCTKRCRLFVDLFICSIHTVCLGRSETDQVGISS